VDEIFLLGTRELLPPPSSLSLTFHLSLPRLGRRRLGSEAAAGARTGAGPARGGGVGRGGAAGAAAGGARR